jgi:hypothetical protein
MPNPDPHPTPAENTSATSRIVEGRPGSIEGDIDQRMANLLKDHQEMGARPADAAEKPAAKPKATKK